MTAIDVQEVVLTDTPCHLFRDALKSLETNKTVTAVAAPVGRKPGTYPKEHLEKIKLRIAKALF
jgi:hypothetical protein